MNATIEVNDDRVLELSYENPQKTVRVEREWRIINETTVRVVEKEKVFDRSDDLWYQARSHVRKHDIDSDGLLIGDGSNWDGEGRHWKEHAQRRYRELLSLRFPYVEFEGTNEMNLH